MLSKEECAVGTGQRSNYATAKDAQIMSFKEGCVSDMGQRFGSNYVAEKDAQIWFREEECAAGMGHITTQMMDLLHLGQKSNN